MPRCQERSCGESDPFSECRSAAHFRWLAKEKILAEFIGEKLELSKEEHRLPIDVLTASEVERVLNETGVATPLGLRDRAILATFYSTAIRCGELVVPPAKHISPGGRPHRTSYRWSPRNVAALRSRAI